MDRPAPSGPVHLVRQSAGCGARGRLVPHIGECRTVSASARCCRDNRLVRVLATPESPPGRCPFSAGSLPSHRRVTAESLPGHCRVTAESLSTLPCPSSAKKGSLSPPSPHVSFDGRLPRCIWQPALPLDALIARAAFSTPPVLSEGCCAACYAPEHRPGRPCPVADLRHSDTRAIKHGFAPTQG